MRIMIFGPKTVLFENYTTITNKMVIDLDNIGVFVFSNLI